MIASGRKGDAARKAAEVALAAGRPEWADILLEQAGNGPQVSATLARRKWYDGDMAGAVAVLDGQAGNLAKQRSRLMAEVRVFRGGPRRCGRRQSPRSRGECFIC